MKYIRTYEYIINKPKFIITVGISGSGKSRWINSLVDDYTVISTDEIRKELSNDVSNQFVNKEVFKTAIDRSIAAINMGKNVIFDATNIESIYRKEMLKFIKQNTTREFDALAKIFVVDPEISKERIKRDLELNIDRSNVPPEVIDTQHQMFLKDLDKIESDGYKILEKVSVNNEQLKNNVFLIDCSGSFLHTLKKKIKEINFYLTDRFTAILCFAPETDKSVYKNITMSELIKIVTKMSFGYGGNFQDVIDDLVDMKINGNILLFTDGYDDFDLTELPNQFTILTADRTPIVKGNCYIFKDDLESLKQFYPPRDITYDNYLLKKDTNKYNL